MADALSRKSSNLAIRCGEWLLLELFRELDATVKLISDKVALVAMSVLEPNLIQQIKDEQFTDPKSARI